MKPTYKVIEKNEEVPELSKIEKSNITANITLSDTIQAHTSNKKGMEQIEAEVKIKKAIMQNVVNNYPEAVQEDEKLRIAAHTYYEAERFVKFAEEKLAEFAKAQGELEEEIADIEAQTGLKKRTAEEIITITRAADVTPENE